MYCPSCGKATSSELKFCRACGLSLEKVARSLAEQLPAADLDKNLRRRQGQIERWLSILLGSAFGIFVIAVIWTLIYKLIIVKGDVLTGVIFLGLFIALVVALLLVVYRESLLEASTKRRASQLMQQQSEPPLNSCQNPIWNLYRPSQNVQPNCSGLKRRAALKSVSGSPNLTQGSPEFLVTWIGSGGTIYG